MEGFKFSRQMPVGPFICDFLCREKMLIVEVDGGQHSENAKDVGRTSYLQSQGYRVIRFWNDQAAENLEGVIQAIALALKESPPPAPSRQREGKSRGAATGWAPAG